MLLTGATWKEPKPEMLMRVTRVIRYMHIGIYNTALHEVQATRTTRKEPKPLEQASACCHCIFMVKRVVLLLLTPDIISA